MRKNILVCILALLFVGYFQSSVSAESSSSLGGGSEEGTSTLVIDMDNCLSDSQDGSNYDFSEFTGTGESTEGCPGIEIVGGNLYRNNPNDNPHSCTAGMDGTTAMCVAPLEGCDYVANSDAAVRIDVQVTPGGSGSGALTGLSFYELSPATFAWINGRDGINNDPTLYAVRVSKNGIVIFEESGIATSGEWSLESFDFSDNAAFTVTSATTFNVELVAYCANDNGGFASVWDLENITFNATCHGADAVTPASISSNGATEITVCASTPGAVIDVTMDAAGSGESSAWVITDADGNILDLPAGPPFDLTGAGAGTCLIWNLSYNGDISGAEVGANASGLIGCYALSNPITVYRNTVNGGVLMTEGGEMVETMCGGGTVTVTLSMNEGAGSAYVVTDENLNIIAISDSPIIDINGSGTFLIWHLSFEGDLQGAEVGANAGDLVGCFDLSNSIVVTSGGVSAGTISIDGATDVSICNGGSLTATLEGNDGSEQVWVITDEDGNILESSDSNTFDFTGSPAGVCLIWSITHDGTLAINGPNASDLAGCFALSNSIRVVRGEAIAGTIGLNDGSTSLSVCSGDATGIDVVLNGTTGGTWVLTDTNGNIIDFPAGPPFNFTGRLGTFLLWHVAGTPGGAGVGVNASDLTGCFALSNAITFNFERGNGAVISTPENTTDVRLCLSEGDRGIVPLRISPVDATGVWVVTDGSGFVTSTDQTPPFDFTDAEDICYVYHYAGNASDVAIGTDLTLFNACSDLSNRVRVQKNFSTAASITFGDGSSVIDICSSGSVSRGIDVVVTGGEGIMRLLVTDLDGNIVALPGSSPFGIENDNLEACIVYNLSYEGTIGGLNSGLNISNLTGCYKLSNGIRVNKTNVNGGSITPTETGDNSLEICAARGESVVVDVTLRNNSEGTGVYVVTDGRGFIIDTNAGNPVDFSQYEGDFFFIYHVTFQSALENLTNGVQINSLAGGCFGVSNAISVLINGSLETPGITLGDGTTETTICVDGTPDPLDILMTGTDNVTYVITDVDGNILDLGGNPPFDLDGAGVGVCLIWALSGSTDNAAVGVNAGDLTGCFTLSNPITVYRNDAPTAPAITFEDGSTQVAICAGDGVADPLNVIVDGADDVLWAITDTLFNIISLPTGPPFDFEGAGPGVCLIWAGVGSADNLEVGVNGLELTGCFALSSPLIVIRNEVSDAVGITLEDGSTETTICAGDGTPDPLNVTVDGDSNVTWVVTDSDGNILALPAGPPFDFDGAGAGTCLIWALTGSASNAAVGVNAADLEGCFTLSNAITVNRNEADGGSVETPDPSKVNFDMEECYSDFTDGSNQDYSEFTGSVMNADGCPSLEVMGGFFYRDNGATNPHSCTPGVDGSVGMCVGAADDCAFAADSDKAIRFDILVTPGTSGTGGLGSLSFFEQAPATFSWINGADGVNNTPTQFGVRVTKNGEEVYSMIDMGTSSTWTEVVFDFSGNDAFTVTEDCIFSFELLAYCTEDNGGQASVWDIDEMMVTGTCTITTTGGGCSDPLTDEETTETSSLEILSNPVLDNVVLNIDNKLNEEKAIIIVRNSYGDVVANRNVTLTSGINTEEIALSDFANGMYYVTLVIGNEKHSKVVAKTTY